MKKSRTMLLVCLSTIASFALDPNDFFGIWDLNALPGTDSVFACVQEYTAAGCTMKSKLDRSELNVVDGPSQGNGAIASDSGKAFAHISRTPASPSDTVWEWSVGIEFMVPDSLDYNGQKLFSMGNLYSEDLEISAIGTIANHMFLYSESPEVIESDKWYQFVASVKVGHESPDDTTGFLTLYLNGKKLCDFNDPKLSMVSGGWYCPFHLLESLTIGVSTISYVALLNKAVDSAEVVELQKDFFQTAIGKRPSSLRSGRSTVISIRQVPGGIYLQAGKIHAGTVKIFDITGRTLYALDMDKGQVFLPRNTLAPGVYVYRLKTNCNKKYSGKLSVR